VRSGGSIPGERAVGEIRRAVIVMAKEPVPGRVKTRLMPELSPGIAAALYRSFLFDVLESTAAVPRADLFCFVHPPAAVGWFREQVGPRYRVQPQSGALLSERMIAAFEELFRLGYGAVVMRNSDSPTLPAHVVGDALDALEHGRDFAIGPDYGGGYYLVGMRRSQPTLFRGVAMSTTSVLDETRRRARALGLSIHEAPRWLDIDTAEDLARLREQLDPARRVERALCERTEALLATLPRLQQRLPPDPPAAAREGSGRSGGPPVP
jgi:rSAM/selenodomain-associated transferase 1